MKTLLITGASGFTGQHLIPAATKAGWHCIGLNADLTDAVSVTEEVARAAPDAAVHLAAVSYVAHADAAQIYAVNVVGTLNLLDALSHLPKKPSVVCLSSSSTVYGNCIETPIAESQAPAPNSHYSASKLVMEHLSRNYAGELPLVFLRFFSYTGPGHSDQFVIPKLVDHFARRADSIELGNLDVEREFNDVRMVVEAYLRLLKRPGEGEVLNVCSGRPIALRAAIDALTRLTGHTMQVVVNPLFVRANEIRSSCGDPGRLHGVIGQLPIFALDDTLSWMLSEHR